MSSSSWESYYQRSYARRGGSLRAEDCYCSAAELIEFLKTRGKLPAISEAKILVVGSGTSLLPVLLKSAVTSSASSADVTAMDVSSTAVKWMREKYEVDGLTWVEGDASDMDTSWHGVFDLLLDKGLLGSLSAEVDAEVEVEHKANQLLAQYRKAVKDGGQIQVVMPSKTPWLPRLGGSASIEAEEFRETWIYTLDLPPQGREVPEWALDVQFFPGIARVCTKFRKRAERRSVELLLNGHVARLIAQIGETKTYLELDLPFPATSARWDGQTLEMRENN